MAEIINSIPGVQVGDSVWSCPYGYGTVTEVNKAFLYSVHAHFGGRTTVGFSENGKSNLDHRYPSIFYAPWSGEHGVDPYPPRPKKTEKKWCWIFGDGRFLSIGPFFILRPMSELQAEEFRIEHKLDWKQRIDVTAQDISD